MELLVLGGTAFLGRAVVDAGLSRGHAVTTYTRGCSGAPQAPATALHGDRTSARDLDAALAGRRFDAVIDTSCQALASARLAAERLAYVDSYIFVSSLNAYRDWPRAPLPDERVPTWEEETDDYGPMKAASERILGAALGGRFLTARAGLIAGPHDDMGRLPWWLSRVAAGGRMVVPDDLDRQIALIDVRDLAEWLVDAAERRLRGRVNTTGPLGMTTLGGLLRACADAVDGDAAAPVELVPIGEERLLAAGVQPWLHLPLWLPEELAATAWQVGTARARELGLRTRPVADTVRDTWAWLRDLPQAPVKGGVQRPGLPPELERELLTSS